MLAVVLVVLVTLEAPELVLVMLAVVLVVLVTLAVVMLVASASESTATNDVYSVIKPKLNPICSITLRSECSDRVFH